MIIKDKRIIIFLAVLMLCASVLFSEKTPVDHLYHYKLDNGLTVFAAENHSVPLVYIELAVRAGAVTQTPENAGLFHFYEHMMFKGNSKYQSAEDIQYALKNLGVASWNGSTSTNMVNYFFTIPSDQLENGLEFWSNAIRNPLMNPVEFENEKKVVISEINGGCADPNWQLMASISKTLFPKAPYLTDSAGSATIVQNATVAQMRDMQKCFYTPNNTAVFVGGDIDPDKVYKLVNKIYGSWERGDDVWAETPVRQSSTPLTETGLYVMPFPVCATETAQIITFFRGPDADFDCAGTYSADMLMNFLSEPAGTYCQTLVKNKKMHIPEINYVNANYTTQRRTSLLQFAAMVLEPEDNLPERAKLFASQITDKILPAVVADKKLYTQKKMQETLRHLRDTRVYETETAQGLLSTVRYWWITNSQDYYFTYPDKMAEVGSDDIASMLDTYVYGKSPMIIVLINPQVYEKTKQSFSDAGYSEITADNAFWWKAAASVGETK